MKMRELYDQMRASGNTYDVAFDDLFTVTAYLQERLHLDVAIFVGPELFHDLDHGDVIIEGYERQSIKKVGPSGSILDVPVYTDLKLEPSEQFLAPDSFLIVARTIEKEK